MTGVTHQMAAYIPGLLVPSLVNLLGLTVFTRLLSAEAYGRYALVMVIVASVKLFAFEWLRHGLFRYFHKAQHDGRLSPLLATALAGFLVTCGVVSAGWVMCLVALPSAKLVAGDLWLGLVLLLAWSLFDILLQLNRVAFAPVRYGYLAGGRAVLGLITAITCILMFRYEEEGILAGMIVGTVIPVLFELPRWLRRAMTGTIERAYLKDLLVYGMPLTITLALGLCISTGDRFFIQYFLGFEAVGLYAAGYDLAQQCLMLLFTVVNLASYPLVLKAIEQDGPDAAQGRCRQMCTITLALTLPTLVGLAYFAGPLAAVLLSKAFQPVVESLLPTIALSAFLMGIKAFYFDLAFQIGERTGLQIWAVVVGGAVGLVLNMIWIPAHGIPGAAYAAVMANASAMIVSALLGRSVYRLSFPWFDLGRIALAAGFMWLLLTCDPKP